MISSPLFDPQADIADGRRRGSEMVTPSRPLVGPLLAALCCLAVATGPVGAGARPVRGGGDPAPEVVVLGRPGPALWSVTRGASELVILGSVTPTAEAGTWNTRLVASALQGARVLMLSPGSTPGLAWAENFSESRRYLLSQPWGRTLYAELGSEDAVRFGRMAAEIGRPSSQYGSYRPGPAGMILLEDSWRARGLTGSKLNDTVVGLAKAAHVRVVKVDEGGALPLIDAMTQMSKPQHGACIDQAMDQFELEGSNAVAGFQAWAHADLARLRRSYRPLSLCLDSIPGGAARRNRARAIWLKALGEALQTPGRTVAVVDVSDLWEPSDLLASLEAQGGTVTRPHEASSPAPLIAADRQERAPKPAVKQVSERSAPDLRRPAPIPVGTDRVAIGPVRPADGPVCVQAASVGTLFLHRTCHTAQEWTELEKRRSLDQMRDLRGSRRTAGGDAP